MKKLMNESKKSIIGSNRYKWMIPIVVLLFTLAIRFIVTNSTLEKNSDFELLSIYVNGQEVFEMPTKESGYTLSSESNCNNGVTISWDDATWSAKVNYENFQNNNERTRCNLYFGEKSTIRVVSSSDTSGMWNYKNSITKLVIQDNLKEIPNAVATNDESSFKDGSIMSYLVLNEDNSTYTAYLQGNKFIYLNPNSSNLFKNFNKLQTIEGMEYLDSSNVTNMRAMFRQCSSLTSLDLSSLDTTNVTNMSYMFYQCSSLTSLDLSPLDTTNVTKMSAMFEDCSKLTSLDLSPLDTTNVTDMSAMFLNCSSLTSLDLSSFNTAKVKFMNGMFCNCSSLTSLNLSSFSTTNVTDMGSMFLWCSSLTYLDLSSFHTENVMSFYSNPYAIGSASNVNDGMFSGCKNLTTINYGDNFVYKEGAITTNMFKNCPANKPTDSSWSGVTF